MYYGVLDLKELNICVAVVKIITVVIIWGFM
jgi:hypothetical protein